MAKLRFILFSPYDWINDTRALSAQAKGCWIDVLCLMWNAPERGKWTGSHEEFARATGIPWEDAPRIIQELSKVATATFDDNKTTLINRRMVKEQIAYEYKLNRDKRYRERHKNVAKASRKTFKTLQDVQEVQDIKTSTSIAAGAAKTYPIPDPKTNPKACLVLLYKTCKGFNFNNRDWDKANYGRSIAAAGTLLGLCGDLSSAEACMKDLSVEYDTKGLTWTLETICRNAQEWLKRNGRTNADTSRAGLRLAITQQRSERKNTGGLEKITTGTLPLTLRDGSSLPEGHHPDDNGREDGLDGGNLE